MTQKSKRPLLQHRHLQRRPRVQQLTQQPCSFFVLLVANSTTVQLYFKLSQKGGKYEYNTMSAMVITEGFKLLISVIQIMITNKGNVAACAASIKAVSRQVKFAYLFLAVAYAVYNQINFYIYAMVDPGTFALFKSLTPGAVAFLQFIAFRMNLTQSQVLCVIIQMCGIIPVSASTNTETGKVEFTYGAYSVVVILAMILYGAFNSVYNARVVKNISADYSVPVQNAVLYSFGVVVNLALYFITLSPGDPQFFHGYDNANVFIMLFLNSTVGITISMVYKYGDAVLKSLAQPVVSSLLLFFSKVLFGAPLDIIKLSGAGTVIVSTVLYLKLPSAPPRVAPTAIAGESQPLSRNERGSVA